MSPLEVLRISTVVDRSNRKTWTRPLEVLRISTVVDPPTVAFAFDTFGSTKNFYCCRFYDGIEWVNKPLEVLRISTVVDVPFRLPISSLWKY